MANAKGTNTGYTCTRTNRIRTSRFIVTGTLWDTPIKDVAESVTVFSEDALQDRQATHFQDLVNAIPNLTVQEVIIALVIFNFVVWEKIPNLKEKLPILSVRFLIDDFDFTGIGGIASFFDLNK